MSRAFNRIAVGLAVAAFSLIATSANAQTVTFYFTLKSDTAGSTEITTANIGAVGSKLDLSVWVKTSAAFSAFAGESFLQFDRTTSTDPNNAVLSQNKIGLFGNSLSALTPSGAFSINNGVYYDIDNKVSPSYFGIGYDFGAGGGTPVNVATKTKLYDISLSNKGLNNGQSYVVRLVNNGTTQETQNNFLVNGAGTKLSDGANLTIAAVPEPATLAVFGLGIVPFLRRRRAK